MKKIKSLFYVFVLALVFVGATGVVKASAVETYQLTWNVPMNCSVRVFASEIERESGTYFNEGTTIDIVLTAPSGFVMEVESSDVELTKLNQGYSFMMPAKAVNLSISMGPEVQNPSQGGSSSGEVTEGDFSVEYAKEQIEVNCMEQVYYQIVKTADQKNGLKNANWVKAAKQGNKYCIDFSATSNGKDAYFALTTDNTKDTAAVVVTVDAVVKSVKVGLNYKTEVISDKGLADIIASLNVKGVDKTDDKPKATAAEYQLKWKRGANGTWAEATDFEQIHWDMLKASNGTLYISIDGKAGAETTEFRMSKEAKVKIPKSAKAPNVKVDFVKGTLALKNGMQVRVNDNTEWMDVIAYDKTAEDNGAFALASANLKTGKKVSNVAIADFVAAVKDANVLNMTSVKDGDALTVEVRTAATDKKFPSMTATMELVLPKAAPAMAAGTTVTYTKADKENDVDAEFIIDFKLIQSAGITTEELSKYEYILADKAEDKIDFAKQKWTKVPEGGKLDLSSKLGKTYTCALEGGKKATVKYEDTSVIYFRKAAVKPDTKNGVSGVFASATAKATVVIAEKVVEEKSYAIGCVTVSNDAIVSIKINGNAVDVGDAITKANAAITFTYKASSDTKEADTVKISYQETDRVPIGEPMDVELNADNGEYSFTMPAADVTITITEKDKETTGT